MRILIYTVIRMNGAYGARVNLETLAGKLAQRGHEVVLFTPAAPGGVRSFSFPVVYLKPEGTGCTQKVLQDLRAGVELLRLARRGQAPQVVLSRFGINTIALPIICKILGIRYVADVHGSYEQTLLNEHRVPRMLLPLFLSVEKLNYLLSDRIITVSDELSALVTVRRGEGRVHTVPNGIDTELFSPEAAPDAVFRERTRGGKTMVFGFVGMFNRWLGVSLIVEAFALLKRERPRIAEEVKVVLVGDGSERSALERLIEREGLQEMVTITGWVDHEEVPRYLRSFDVALAPYVSDANTRGWGSSLKIMEYLAAGRWTIASEMTVVSPIIRETASGYILPSATPAAIVEAVVHAWEHRDELGRRAEKGASYIREKLSWDVRVRRIEEILCETLAEPSPAGNWE